MIHYKDPLAKLKAKGYTTTDLRKEKYYHNLSLLI